jgi:catechol 2,3-dioxygenase-like lactoylglutathione lyase family enzyme
MALKFEHVTFDCANAARLADFWAGALGWSVGPGANAEWAVVGGPDRPRETPGFLFLRVPEPKPGKNRFHPDFLTDDLDREVRFLVGNGATLLAEKDEWGARWATLADPEGNEFDVIQRREDGDASG